MKLIKGRLYKDNSGSNVRLLSNYIDTSGDVTIIRENSRAVGCIGFRKPKDLTPLPIDHECLKQITEPFGMLDKEVQEALMAIKCGKNIQLYNGGEWENANWGFTNYDESYRLDPEWQPEEEKEEEEDKDIQEQLSNINKRLGAIENKLGKFQSLRWECRR